MTTTATVLGMDTKMKKFEIEVWGGAMRRLPRYVKKHQTLEAAVTVAKSLVAWLQEHGCGDAHPVCITGPGLPSDGKRIGY
jgi:hypothetical protein